MITRLEDARWVEHAIKRDITNITTCENIKCSKATICFRSFLVNVTPSYASSSAKRRSGETGQVKCSKKISAVIPQQNNKSFQKPNF